MEGKQTKKITTEEAGDESSTERKWKKRGTSSSSSVFINNLDDGCLMHIFSFLSPIPDRYNSALVCHRWLYLACHPRLWLRVDRSLKDSSEPGVFPNIELAVAAARPGDTILIAAGGSHPASNIQIKKPLCLYFLDKHSVKESDEGRRKFIFDFTRHSKISSSPTMTTFMVVIEFLKLLIGGGELPDDTTLVCPRGAESALEFLCTSKLANLTVKAELGCCLLHKKGRLTIDGCILQCESNPLDYLSCPIVSTATASGRSNSFPAALKSTHSDGVSVSQTRIEGGAKAVLTSGDLALQRVRVIYARTSLFFWFDVEPETQS